MIVEGNGKTQFLGQQITDEIGKKEDFENLINYKKLREVMKHVPRWELELPVANNSKKESR